MGGGEFDSESNISIEWFESNGAGSYAASTGCGRNDRRYHGLLVAALEPPVSRYLLLSKMEETLDAGSGPVELSTNQYPGVVHPRGFVNIKEIARDPFPRTVWSAGGGFLTKTVMMPRGERTVVICYEWKGAARAKLALRPLVAFRKDHHILQKDDLLRGGWRAAGGAVAIRPRAELPELYFTFSAPPFETGEGHGWYQHFEYAWEKKRGFDFQEDLFNPVFFNFELCSGEKLYICASIDRREFGDVITKIDQERARRESLRIFDDPIADELATRADAFLVERDGAATIFAGYPWFADWGRDTMIALPGIACATGRHDEARQCLRNFLMHSRAGIIPNRFLDEGSGLEYNNVDASLWMFEVARLLYEVDNINKSFVLEEMYPILRSTVETFQGGGPFGIHAGADGWIYCGVPGVALTWMDARVNGVPVTPRHGAPVEIQALWHHANRVLAQLARARRESVLADICTARMLKLEENFERAFWCESGNYYYDCIRPDGRPDAALRPNQIFVMLMAPELVSDGHARAALQTVRETLLTPCGLRTLAASDPNHKYYYSGGPSERDAAYHQGTVWPWLLGPFARAWAAYYDSATALQFLEPVLLDITRQPPRPIYEIADSAPPHAPDGCFAQAWNIGELLRAHLQLRGLRARPATTTC